MGNSPSKPSSRHASTSSTTPLNVDVSNPTTPTPLLTSFPTSVEHPRFNDSISSPTALVAPPITPATTTFPFPGRLTQIASEVTVSAFAGDSPPHSRPASSFPGHRSNNQSQAEFNETNGISHPKPARPHVRHLSELIDPEMLAADEEKAIRSPSGNMLGRHSFEERLDRPRSMRERQERVRQQMMLQRSQGGLRQVYVAADDSEKTAEAENGNRAKKRGGFCSCFGF